MRKKKQAYLFLLGEESDFVPQPSLASEISLDVFSAVLEPQIHKLQRL